MIEIDKETQEKMKIMSNINTIQNIKRDLRKSKRRITLEDSLLLYTLYNENFQYSQKLQEKEEKKGEMTNEA